MIDLKLKAKSHVEIEVALSAVMSIFAFAPESKSFPFHLNSFYRLSHFHWLYVSLHKWCENYTAKCYRIRFHCYCWCWCCCFYLTCLSTSRHLIVSYQSIEQLTSDMSYVQATRRNNDRQCVVQCLIIDQLINNEHNLFTLTV